MDQGNKIPIDEIKLQVDRICSSIELNTKPKLCLLLRYLVEETIAGREEKLKGYTIGVELFEKERDFDANQDPLVRIHAGRLRRMLRMYYLEKGKNNAIRIDIPKGKYIPVFLPNPCISEIQHTTQTDLGKLPIEPLIAILPFKNLSGDPDKEFFALGFSEELSVELTKFESLGVINGMLLAQIEESSRDKTEFIRNLGVRFMIDGSVSLSNNQVKILVKLSDLADNKQIWADRYLREFSVKNLIEIQEEIAQEIASELGSEYGIIFKQLTAESKRKKPQILDTFNAILKYYYFEVHQTPEAAADAFHALEEAILKEPESGIATAMLASLHGNRYILDLSGASESYEKFALLAENALRLDPNSSTVRIMYLWKCFAYNEKVRFFEEVDKCLAMNPNSSLRFGSIGFYLSLYGDWERGKSILDRVMGMKVRFPHYFFGATTLYYYRIREYEKALKEANQYDVASLFWGPLLRAAIAGQQHRTEEAKSNIAHLMQLKPDFEEKAHYLIRRFVKEDDLVEHIVDGLRKAGLKIS